MADLADLTERHGSLVVDRAVAEEEAMTAPAVEREEVEDVRFIVWRGCYGACVCFCLCGSTI